jgi:hypothetical protein
LGLVWDLALSGEALDAVRGIIERLGGLPLGLEVAPPRSRMLSPRLILERLGRSLRLGGGARALPECQRTLTGAIGWSYQFLQHGASFTPGAADLSLWRGRPPRFAVLRRRSPAESWNHHAWDTGLITSSSMRTCGGTSST